MKDKLIIGITSVMLSGSAAFANSFGALPSDVTFGGSGIDNTSAEIATVNGTSGDTLTLGLEATPYSSPPGPLANNGNGTYFANAGASPFNAHRATWNFDYYIADNGGSIGNYTFSLIINNGTTTTTLDPVAIANADSIGSGGKTTAGGTAQDSENIDFYGYNFSSGGTYDITLDVLSAGNVIGSDSIAVDVAPEVTSTLPLLGAALIGLAFVSRRAKTKAA